MREALLARVGEALRDGPTEAIGEKRRDQRILIRLWARPLLVDRVEGRTVFREQPSGPLLSVMMAEGVRALGAVSDLALPIVDTAQPPHALLCSDSMEGERE